MPDEEVFPVDLDEGPVCELVRQWVVWDPPGVQVTRYCGADGYLYECVQPEGGEMMWTRVGWAANGAVEVPEGREQRTDNISGATFHD